MLYTEFVFKIVLTKILISSKFPLYFDFWPGPVDRPSRPEFWQSARIRVHVCRSTGCLPTVDRNIILSLSQASVDRSGRPIALFRSLFLSVDRTGRPIACNGRIFCTTGRPGRSTDIAVKLWTGRFLNELVFVNWVLNIRWRVYLELITS